MRTNGAIYAILDTVANDLVGMFPLQIFKAPAAAVRYFSDAAANEKTQIGQHPEDFTLVCLGYLTDNHTIEANQEPEIIITGKAWLAARPQATDQDGETHTMRLAK